MTTAALGGSRPKSSASQPSNSSVESTVPAVRAYNRSLDPTSRYGFLSFAFDPTTADGRSVEEFTVNGFPAATAAASGTGWAFRLFAVRFGSDVYRFIFATKQRTTESERNARETVNSFRRLTLEEIQSARPLRIKVITVQPGDTVESLSHRMAGVDRPAERFRILNGLDQHAQVKTRDRVKIVVD